MSTSYRATGISLLVLIACFFGEMPVLYAQKPPLKKYWVTFTDKNNTPFCVCQPTMFLSARSLARRQRANVPVTEEDLPVDPAYVQALRDKGAQWHSNSRWLNAAAVIADSSTAAGLRDLPFVAKVEYIGKHIYPKNPPNRPVKKRGVWGDYPKAGANAPVFGYAARQNAALGMPYLYWAGHRGAGIWVAVMDGGFVNVDTMPFFDSTALQARLFPGWDFVERDGAVFESAQHGTSVLSVMAANLPGYFVGTAPDATYFLLKTEDTGGEFPVEETNWIAGAEWADSIGVDVINASLGYTSFNDNTLSHRYHELDGRTAIGSRGAAIAAQKGMIVCNSAGNSGDEPWRHIGVPADAPGVVAVGAVGDDGKRASFSSVGPSADGRIKPELVAPGDQVVTAGYSGTSLGVSSGTSLASPMLAGAIASLWSAYPEKTAPEILGAVFRSADQYAAPDPLRGYGLPDMVKAWFALGGFSDGETANDAGSGLFAFHRDQGTLSFIVFGALPGAIESVRLYDALGQAWAIGAVSTKQNRIATLTMEGLSALPPGAYRVQVCGREGVLGLWGLVWR